MRLILRSFLAVALCLGGVSVALSAFVLFQVKLPNGDVICNVTTGNCTGVGGGSSLFTAATCDGVASDSAAFSSFNTWATGTWQASHTGTIELTIPSGSVCRQGVGTGVRFAAGIKNLIVSGNGATLGNPGGTGDNWTLGSIGVQTGAAQKGLVASVSAGATSVTLLTLTDNAKFIAGAWVLISGFDMQGSGYPPNAGFFEYIQVTNVNAGTGVVSFTPALTQSYKSTWPNYGADQMGPVALWVTPSGWDIVVEYRGLTIDSNAQVYASGRYVSFRNVTFTSQATGNSITPSFNQTMAIYGSTCVDCTMEVDKLISTVTIDRSTWYRLLFQSASVKSFQFNNSTVTSTWFGTGSVTAINNSTIDTFGPGATVSGASGEVICTSCVINTMSPGGTGSGIIPAQSAYTMTGGVIKYDNALKAQNWVFPGGNMFWVGGRFNQQGPVFQIIDVTQDASFTYVSTTMAGTFATDVPDYGSTIAIHTHPAPAFTCTNCSGDAGLSLNGAPAKTPLGTYFTKTYPGAVAYTQYPYVWGYIDSISVNVTVALTGMAAPTFNFNFPGILNPSTNSDSNSWNPQFNPKQIGARIITSTTVTGTQSGDTLSIPTYGANTFIPGPTQALKPVYSVDTSGNPVSTTIILKTNQGVVYP